jgi:hypothetical protein
MYDSFLFQLFVCFLISTQVQKWPCVSVSHHMHALCIWCEIICCMSAVKKEDNVGLGLVHSINQAGKKTIRLSVNQTGCVVYIVFVYNGMG